MRMRTTAPDLTLPRRGRAAAPMAWAAARLLGAWRAWRAARTGTGAQRWQAAQNATAAFHPGPGGLTLTCVTGTFLVTQAGDPADHVLEPGDAMKTCSRGRVAAWALRAGVLCVRPGPGAGAP